MLPWEDRVNYPRFMDRITGTLKTLLQPSEAGKALGGYRSILPSLTFMAVVGLPLAWISQIIIVLFGPPNPMEGIQQLFGLPAPPPPPPDMQSFQRVMQVLPVVLMPLSLAIGLGIWGLLVHGGLWATGALRPGRGLEATFRTLLYSSALMFLVSWAFNFWIFLPPITSLAVLALSTLCWLGFAFYQGTLLAKAHETQVWRGILGLFAPCIFFLCCCGGLGLLAGLLITGAGMNR